MPVRASTSAVLATVRARFEDEGRAAAGNTLLSRAEQDALPPGLLADAAATVRGHGPSRVKIEAVIEQAALSLEALLANVNGRGPGVVSKAEVLALHATSPDAGARVARAYELITGKHIELPTNVPVPVVPPVVTPGTGTPARGSPMPISAFTQTPDPQMPNAGPTTLQADGTLRFKRGALLPTTVSLEVGGQTFVAEVTMSSGRNSSLAMTPDIVEAIRRAVAPAYDVRVNEHGSDGTVLELFALEAPPPPDGPVYLFASGKGAELRGPLRFVTNQSEVFQPGESYAVRIDDKVYTATATQPDTSAKTLLRELRDLAVADGHTIDLREYTNYAPWTFIVTP